MSLLILTLLINDIAQWRRPRKKFGVQSGDQINVFRDKPLKI